MRTKKIALGSLLVALALVLSFVEKMFPLDALLPVPGIKLGLANIVTLLALVCLRFHDALAILLLRVALGSMLFGGVTGFLFSLFGGMLALAAMKLLLRLKGKRLSFLGISVAGAAAHNIGQIFAAVLWMGTTTVVAYLPFLLFSAIPLGLVTGITAHVAMMHIKNISMYE